MAKVWKKLQRADSDYSGTVTGNVSGTVDGVAVATIKSGAAAGGTANQDDTATIRAGTTAANVGLGNVPNYTAATMRAGVTKSDVGLANVANETRATILGGAFTGTIGGTSASTVKDKAVAAKDAVDGNAAVTMVGGSININSGEWTVDSNGNQVVNGTITINKDSGGDAGLTLDSGSSGDMKILMEGANPQIDMGGTAPLGTTSHFLRRGGTGNQCRTFYTTGSTVIGCIGFANQPSAYNDQFAIHTEAIYDNSSPYKERALSFDADGKMGMYANTKTHAGFTFGTDGTNKGVYVKDGGLSIGTSTVTDNDLRCTDVFASGGVTTGNSSNALQISDGNVYLGRNSLDMYLYAYSGYIFNRNGGESMRIDNSGNLAVSGTGTSTFAGQVQLSDGNQVQWGGSTNAIFGSNASNYVKIKTNSTDRMTIDSSGNTTFEEDVTVKGNYVNINAGGVNSAFATDSDCLHFIADSNANGGSENPFEFWHNSPTIDGGSKLLHIGNSGDLWIANDLSVTGSISSGGITSTGSVITASGSESAPGLQLGSANDGFFHNGGIRVVTNNVWEALFKDGGDFHTDGDIIAYSTTTTSDRRLKTDVVELEDNLKKIIKLEPVKFDWLVKDKGEDIGFIAQDIQKVIPEVVKEVDAIGETAEFLDDDTMLTVDYGKLVPVLVGAIQELKQEIEDLKENCSGCSK